MGLDSNRDALGAAESLPPDLRDAYLVRSRSMKVRRGQIVMSEGDEAADVYLICGGKMQVSLLSPQGREIILRDLTAGHVFGETAVIDGLPRSANVEALEDSLLARMSGPDFLDFIETVPGMGLWMARLLTARIRDLTERAFELATLPVAARVHRELLLLALEGEKTGDQVLIRDMPKHADLAARVGTHREAVTRELNSLAGDGVLSQSGRQAAILSVSRLRALYDRMRR